MHTASLLSRADRDLPALTVLALLLTGPRHTYEMHRLMILTHKDFVTGLPRSMYHAVDRLLRDELIAVHEVRRESGRPERTVYALTDAGRAEPATRVVRLLEHPDPDATLLVAALSFAPCVPADRVVLALQTRIGALSEALVRLADVPEGLPRLLLIENEFERSRLGAERDWVEALAGDITSGRLAWPDEIGDLGDLLREVPVEP